MTASSCRAATLLATIVAAAALSACGGSGSSSPRPDPAETVGEFGGRLTDAAQAAASGDCAAVKGFNDEAGFTLPCDGGAKGYGDFKVVDTADFGTAGLVDFTDREAPGGATAAAAINEDGRFRLIQSLVPSSIGLDAGQVGTKATDAPDRDRVVDEFVTAVREQDCDTYFQVALTPTQDKAKECRIEFAPKSQIQPDLESSPDAAPSLLGESQAFGLYELETGDAYRVILALRNYGPDGERPALEDRYRVVSYRSQD